MDGYEDKYYFGRRPTGTLYSKTQNLDGKKRDVYQEDLVTKGRPAEKRLNRDVPNWKPLRTMKEALTAQDLGVLDLLAFGEISALLWQLNQNWGDTVKDKWGMEAWSWMPEIKENEINMRKEHDWLMQRDVLEVAGF